MYFALLLDADDIVQYLHLTRHDFAAEGRPRQVYGNDCFQCSGEEEWTLWFSDYKEAVEDECYPHSYLFAMTCRGWGVSMR